MVRGNWQRRVELTQSKRASVKEKKSKAELQRTYKHRVQDLLRLLEDDQGMMLRGADPSNSNCRLHIWTDKLPANKPPPWSSHSESAFESMDEEPSSRRGRSNSNVSDSSASKNKHERQHYKSSRKAHPRSKKEQDEGQPQAAGGGSQPQKMCIDSFFKTQGQSSHNKKSSSKAVASPSSMIIRYPTKQESSQYPSLAHILTGKEHQQELLNSRQALEESFGDGEEETTEEKKGMPPLYYLSAQLDSTSSMAQVVTQTLLDQSCPHASLVYLAIAQEKSKDHANGAAAKSILLFDRYRDGVQRLAFDSSKNTATIDPSSAKSGSSGTVALPGSLWWQVLTFLPDSAVARVSAVCRSWHSELESYPSLWTFLLERRDWPVQKLLEKAGDVGEATDGDHTSVRSPQEQFHSHYVALRNAHAIQSGFEDLCHSSSNATPSSASASISEGSILEYSHRSFLGLPGAKRGCTSAFIWAPGQCLLAYNADCTLRLFESGTTRGSRLCKELVCYPMDPNRHTKKKSTTILAVALDETVVASLCHVKDEQDQELPESSILVVLSRENLLQQQFAEEEVISIEGAVLNYLLSCTEIDHHLLYLRDYISSQNGDTEDVRIKVGDTMASCGHGRFLLLVSVEFPLQQYEDNEEEEMVTLQKLMLVSSNVGVIVSMCDVEFNVVHGKQTILASPVSDITEMKQEYHIVVSSVGATVADGPILLGSVIGDLVMSHRVVLHGKTPLDAMAPQGEFVTAVNRRGTVAVSGSTFIGVVSVRKQSRDARLERFDSHLFFVSITPGDVVTDNEMSLVVPNLSVSFIANWSEDHVLVVGYADKIQNTVEGDDELGDIDGHWFVGNAENHVPDDLKLVGVLVHVPTKKVIGRVNLKQHGEAEEDQPVSICSKWDTIVATYHSDGLVMTGEECRRLSQSTAATDNDRNGKPKKRKKKAGKRRGEDKKDGFARGMKFKYCNK